MIWRPKPGDRVQVRYRERGRTVEGRKGIVIYASGGDAIVEFPDRHRARILNKYLVEIKE